MKFDDFAFPILVLFVVIVFIGGPIYYSVATKAGQQDTLAYKKADKARKYIDRCIDSGGVWNWVGEEIIVNGNVTSTLNGTCTQK